MRKLLLLITVLTIGFGTAAAQTRQVTGTVVGGSDGAPVAGVVVKVGGTNAVAVSDVSGRFTIQSEPNGVLSFSALGMAEQQVALGGQTDVMVTLEPAINSLEEIVVVGFGTQKKVNLTGAISQVGAEAFENRPVSSIGQALQGVVPNLNVTISNGQPNTTPTFNVRGGTTLEDDPDDSGSKWRVGHQSPLILVDGVEYSPEMLNSMSPNDIGSMTVIKDASAAAIYGTRATYGVILVTTKKGSFGQKGVINYSYDLTLQTPSAIPDLLSAYDIQKATMDRRLYTNAVGTIHTAADELKLERMRQYMEDPSKKPWYMDTGELGQYIDGKSVTWVGNNDPYKMLVKKVAPSSKHHLSISGGSNNVSYYISAGYQTDEGLYKLGNESYNRYNVIARVNAKVKPWFNIEARATYTRNAYTSPYMAGGKGSIWNGLKGSEVEKNISMPIKTAADDPNPNVYTDNILAWYTFGAEYTETKSTTTLAVVPEIVFTPWLKARAELSWTPTEENYNRTMPKHEYMRNSWTSLVSEQADAQHNQALLRKRSYEDYTINTYLTMDKTWGKHAVSAVVGFNQEQSSRFMLQQHLKYLYSAGVQNPSQSSDITAHTNSVEKDVYAARGAFGRVGYIFNKRYLVEINGRYDGSSKFTERERFVFFPSYSAGWIVSEESFMKATRSWLDHFKIRGSYGKLGSQPGNNHSSYYPYQSVMGSGQNFILNGQYATYVNVPGLVSSTLTWQKAATVNVGFDAVFLRDRLSAEFNWYQRTVTDILTQGATAYPSVLGATAPLENSGKMRASGFEIMVKWRDRLSNGLTYSVGATLADERTKVLVYEANPTKLINNIYAGAYTGDIWGYETGGIVQIDTEYSTPLNASKIYNFLGPRGSSGTVWPGSTWLRDRDGSGVIDGGSGTLEDPGDQKIIGNNTPRYKYGVTLDLGWKGFDLSMFFQGVAKRDLWIGGSEYWGGGAGSQWMLERAWTPERADAKFPMYGGAPSVQDGYLVNGAYLRMKQLVLGYTLPTDLTGKVGISKLRLSASAFNVFDITEIPDIYDVDQISTAYPQKRTFVFGAQLTF